MASPAVVGTPAETAVSTASTTHAINLPSGASGNLLLIITARGSVAATFDALTGWTEIVDDGVANGVTIWARTADGTEGATVTMTSSSATRSASIAYEISGAATVAAQAPQISTVATGTSVSPDPTTVTPTGGAKDYLWIAMFAGAGEEADDDTWVNSAPSTPSAFGSLCQKACGIAGSNLGGKVATAHLASNAASMDAGSFNQDVSTGWRAHTIAVHPTLDATLTPPQLTHTREIYAPAKVSPSLLPGQLTHTRDIYTPTVAADATLTPPQLTHTRAINTPVAGVPRARTFDDVDDEITTSIGSCSVTGAFTIAALFRSNVSGELHPIFGVYNSSNQAMIEMEVTIGNVLQARINNIIRQADTAGSVFQSDGWVLCAVSKASGTVAPRFHVYKGGSWTHVDSLAGLTVDDPAASTYVRFGRLGATTVYGDIDFAVGGLWDTNLSDVNIEALATGSATQGWYDSAGGTPVGLWDADQPNVADGLFDLTGNGADQSAITGTSVTPTGPYWDHGIKPLPGQLTHTRAIYDPTVTVNLSPGQLTHTREIYTPAKVSPSLLPGQLTHTRAIYDPTVSPQLLPPQLTHADRQVYAGAVSSGAEAFPDQLAHTRAIYDPAINGSISTGQLVHTRVLYDPSVSPTLLPSQLVHTRSIDGPTLNTTLLPAQLSHARAISSPTLSPQLIPAQLAHSREIFAPTSSVTIPAPQLTHTRAIYTPSLLDPGFLPGWDFLSQRDYRPVLEGDL